MRIFGINFETKKSLRRRIEFLEAELQKEIACKNEVIEYNNEIADAYEDVISEFPFMLGDVVYDLQLKGANGRYTKVKPVKELSKILPVTIDEKNYFKMVKRLDENLVFILEEDAYASLDELCAVNESTEA